MKFLLDTNAWIKILNQRPSQIKEKFANTHPTDIALCSVVKSELYFGAYKSVHRADNLDLLDTLFAQFKSLSFNDKAAKVCGDARAQLAKIGKPIGPYDLQIAGIAVANNIILVTNNTKEFSRIQELQIEDWERDKIQQT